MISAYVRLAGIEIEVTDGWLDTTSDLAEGSPFTLAKSDGVGALQFSTAIYRGGTPPSPDLEALRSLMWDFARAHGLGEPENIAEEQGTESVSVRADFSPNDEHIRVWYVTNGLDLALVTYVAQSPHNAATLAEIADATAMVRSLRLRAGVGTPESQS